MVEPDVTRSVIRTKLNASWHLHSVLHSVFQFCFVRGAAMFSRTHTFIVLKTENKIRWTGGRGGEHWILCMHFLSLVCKSSFCICAQFPKRIFSWKKFLITTAYADCCLGLSHSVGRLGRGTREKRGREKEGDRKQDSEGCRKRKK